MYPITPPLIPFLDTYGEALEGGYIYIGQQGFDPQSYPKNVYWDLAGTLLAVQPLRTRNGYIYNNGNIAPVYIDGRYSIVIQDNKGRAVFKTLDALNLQNVLQAVQVTFNPSGTPLTAVDVQNAIVQHVNSTVAHDAGDIVFNNVPSGLIANNVQGAIDEHILGAGTPSHPASQISVTPPATYTSIQLQALANEMATKIGTKTDKTVLEGYAKSTAYSITSAGTGSFVHNLGKPPKMVNVTLKCIVSDIGYAVNDVLTEVVTGSSFSGNRGVQIYYEDATKNTTLKYQFVNTANAFSMLNKSTGAPSPITNSSWEMYLEVYA